VGALQDLFLSCRCSFFPLLEFKRFVVAVLDQINTSFCFPFLLHRIYYDGLKWERIRYSVLFKIHEDSYISATSSIFRKITQCFFLGQLQTIPPPLDLESAWLLAWIRSPFSRNTTSLPIAANNVPFANLARTRLLCTGGPSSLLETVSMSKPLAQRGKIYLKQALNPVCSLPFF